MSSHALNSALAACGSRLTRLELHFISGELELALLARQAPHLLSLNVSDCAVGGVRGVADLLPRLTHCRLLRVDWRGGAEAWLLESCPCLVSLHQEAGPAITDAWLLSLLLDGPARLTQLTELVVSGRCALTARAAAALATLPQLQRLGDLQDWTMQNEERAKLFQKLRDRWERKMGYSRDIKMNDA